MKSSILAVVSIEHNPIIIVMKHTFLIVVFMRNGMKEASSLAFLGMCG